MKPGVTLRPQPDSDVVDVHLRGQHIGSTRPSIFTSTLTSKQKALWATNRPGTDIWAGGHTSHAAAVDALLRIAKRGAS